MLWLLSALFGIAGGYLLPSKVSALLCATSFGLAYLSAKQYAERAHADLSAKIQELRETNTALREDLQAALRREEEVREDYEDLMKKYEVVYRKLGQDKEKEMEFLVEKALEDT